MVGKQHEVQYRVLDDRAGIPTMAYEGDVGFDLATTEDAYVGPDTVSYVPVGLSVQLPAGFWGYLCGRSSAEQKMHVRVIPGVIDNGYTGPLFVGLQSNNGGPVEVPAGSRPAQLLLLPMAPPVRFVEVTEHEPTHRGEAGFGSSGLTL